VAMLALGWAAPAFAAPTPVAVAEFGYEDTSGEANDQTAAHASRLAAFEKTLRADVTKSGKATLVTLACPPGKCSVDDMQADELTALGKKSGARLLVFGGIHKISTLIEFARVEVVDLDTGKSVLRREVTFRGDSDQAWERAAEYVGDMVGGAV
jgi:hypothetical protein